MFKQRHGLEDINAKLRVHHVPNQSLATGSPYVCLLGCSILSCTCQVPFTSSDLLEVAVGKVETCSFSALSSF
jgi:hypothetical protein